MKDVERNVLKNEVMKELNFIERIIVKVFANTFIKVYNIGRIIAVNGMLK